MPTRPELAATCVGGTASRTQLPAIMGDNRFDELRFRYRPDSAEALRGISFTLKPGEVLGLVGCSGCGKRTIAKPMQRLQVRERGRVLPDGVDLALANPGTSMDAVVRAAKLAGAHEFILEPPEGYDALVGEQGATLSGGQLQRIAIARALITNPRILILDEATSALDYESECIVHDNMRFIARGRCVIIIACHLFAVRTPYWFWNKAR